MSDKKITMDVQKAAQRLGELRKATGLSHIKLSEELVEKYNLGISAESLKASLVKYEVVDKYHSSYRAVAGMSTDRLAMFADYYNVSAGYLLGLAEYPTPNEDIQAIINCTGLSEEAIKNLINLNENIEPYKPVEKWKRASDGKISEVQNEKHTALMEYLNESSKPYKENIGICIKLISYFLEETSFIQNIPMMNYVKSLYYCKEIEESKEFREASKQFKEGKGNYEIIEELSKEKNEKQPMYLWNEQILFNNLVKKIAEKVAENLHIETI